MPCTYTGSIEGDRAYFAEQDRKELEKEVVKLTQLLCEVCRTIEENNETIMNWEEQIENGRPASELGLPAQIQLSKKMKKWWKKHKEQDDERGR